MGTWTATGCGGQQQQLCVKNKTEKWWSGIRFSLLVVTFVLSMLFAAYLRIKIAELELYVILLTEEEKRESEPFAVPMVGAFYMHDDRFRENGSGRHRRTPGGRKLWESKDNWEWVHDQFDELNLQDSCYDEERRRFKGHFQGRGRYRGANHGYVCGNRSRVYDDNRIQNCDHKILRGRGPRRYEPRWKGNYAALVSQNKLFGKPSESTSNANSRKKLMRS